MTTDSEDITWLNDSNTGVNNNTCVILHDHPEVVGTKDVLPTMLHHENPIVPIDVPNEFYDLEPAETIARTCTTIIVSDDNNNVQEYLNSYDTEDTPRKRKAISLEDTIDNTDISGTNMIVNKVNHDTKEFDTHSAILNQYDTENNDISNNIDDTAVNKTTPTKSVRRDLPARISWEDRIASLRAYKEEHGNLNIPIRYKKNPSLGKFVHNTREQYKLYHNRCKPGYQKRCSLTAERIAELDNLGFLWTTERVKRQNDEWDFRMAQLNDYKRKHGDFFVPHGYAIDPSFAEWIHRQRTTYATMKKDDKPNPLVQRRMKQLEDIGFNFTVHTDKWMVHWHMLKAYKEKHGDCLVPTHYVENPKLGRWTHTQRHQRRNLQNGIKSSITKERIDMLDQLNFSWEVRTAIDRPHATWQQRFQELQNFHRIHGHFVIPPDTHPELRRWCFKQRSRLQTHHTLNAMHESGLDSKNVLARPIGAERVRMFAEMGFTSETELDKVPTLLPSPINKDETDERKRLETVCAQSTMNKAQDENVTSI